MLRKLCCLQCKSCKSRKIRDDTGPRSQAPKFYAPQVEKSNQSPAFDPPEGPASLSAACLHLQSTSAHLKTSRRHGRQVSDTCVRAVCALSLPSFMCSSKAYNTSPTAAERQSVWALQGCRNKQTLSVTCEYRWQTKSEQAKTRPTGEHFRISGSAIVQAVEDARVDLHLLSCSNLR